MSVTIAKGAQITRCGNNTSKSNQMYSFGYGKKCNYYRKPQTQVYYDIQSCFSQNVKENKGVSMGRGDRECFRSTKEENAKTYYYKENAFVTKSGSCTTFGKAPISSYRKLNSTSSTLNTGLSNSSYLISTIEATDFGKNSQKSTIKGKLKSIFDVKDNNVPGPGYYRPAQWDIAHDKPASSFSKFTAPRFKNTAKQGTPGPSYLGDYHNISSRVEKVKSTIRSRSTCNSPQKDRVFAIYDKSKEKSKKLNTNKIMCSTRPRLLCRPFGLRHISIKICKRQDYNRIQN